MRSPGAECFPGAAQPTTTIKRRSRPSRSQKTFRLFWAILAREPTNKADQARRNRYRHLDNPSRLPLRRRRREIRLLSCRPEQVILRQVEQALYRARVPRFEPIERRNAQRIRRALGCWRTRRRGTSGPLSATLQVRGSRKKERLESLRKDLFFQDLCDVRIPIKKVATHVIGRFFRASSRTTTSMWSISSPLGGPPW